MAQESNKVGSDPKQAGKVVGKKDFGVHEEDVHERNYVSEETLRNDPGKGIVHSGTGPRTSGVGGNESGRGSSSGGALDADDEALVGIGDESLHPPHQQPQAGGTKPPQTLNPPVMPDDPARAGVLDNESSTSAADVNNEIHQSDSFQGDVTSDEATGGA